MQRFRSRFRSIGWSGRGREGHRRRGLVINRSLRGRTGTTRERQGRKRTKIMGFNVLLK